MRYIQNIQNVYIIYRFGTKMLRMRISIDKYISRKNICINFPSPDFSPILWNFSRFYSTTNEWNGVLLLFSIIHISRYICQLNVPHTLVPVPRLILTTKYHFAPLFEQFPLQLNNSQWENSWKLCCKTFSSLHFSIVFGLDSIENAIITIKLENGWKLLLK